MRNKNKLYWVAGGIVLIIWASYQFSISRTITLWKENRKLEQQQEQISEIPKQLPDLVARVDKLNNILGNGGQEDFSNLVLEEINRLCRYYNIKLKEIPEKHLFAGNNLSIETLQINLQGNYSDQLSLLSDLEKSNLKARIRSVRFETVINQQTGERSLQSEIFLQSIKLLNSNS